MKLVNKKIKNPADYLRQTRRGAMFIFDGPSGSGKNAIIERLMAADKNLKYSVSVTTRAPRQGESEGRPYYFITDAKYDKLLSEDAFYEHVASDYSARYGTLRKEVDSFLLKGTDVVFDMDFPGVVQMKGRAPDEVVSIGILPPSIKKLRERLIMRGDDKATIAKRMRMILDRLSYMAGYDYIVVNDNLEEAVGKVQRIISGERMRRVRQTGMPGFLAQLIGEAKDLLGKK